MAYDRFVIIGKPGSGKTTLAHQLSDILQVKPVELDAIYWQPDWTKPDKPDFQAWVAEAVPADGRWAADGNYSAVREIVWGRATTAIWLDYPLWLSLWRLLWRTLDRWFWRKDLWNGNRENLLDHLSWDWDKNLFLYTVAVHTRHKNNFPSILKDGYGHLNVLRFRHPSELDEWLESLTRMEADKIPRVQEE